MSLLALVSEAFFVVSFLFWNRVHLIAAMFWEHCSAEEEKPKNPYTFRSRRVKISPTVQIFEFGPHWTPTFDSTTIETTLWRAFVPLFDTEPSSSTSPNSDKVSENQHRQPSQLAFLQKLRLWLSASARREHNESHPLLNLPFELHLSIFDHLGETYQDDLQALRQTCAKFRDTIPSAPVLPNSTPENLSSPKYIRYATTETGRQDVNLSRLLSHKSSPWNYYKCVGCRRLCPKWKPHHVASNSTGACHDCDLKVSRAEAWVMWLKYKNELVLTHSCLDEKSLRFPWQQSADVTPGCQTISFGEGREQFHSCDGSCGTCDTKAESRCDENEAKYVQGWRIKIINAGFFSHMEKGEASYWT